MYQVKDQSNEASLSLSFSIVYLHGIQTERGKVSLDEFRDLANKDTTSVEKRRNIKQCIEENDNELMEDEIFSVDDFEETEQISIN